MPKPTLRELELQKGALSVREVHHLGTLRSGTHSAALDALAIYNPLKPEERTRGIRVSTNDGNRSDSAFLDEAEVGDFLRALGRMPGIMASVGSSRPVPYAEVSFTTEGGFRFALAREAQSKVKLYVRTGELLSLVPVTAEFKADEVEPVRGLVRQAVRLLEIRSASESASA